MKRLGIAIMASVCLFAGLGQAATGPLPGFGKDIAATASAGELTVTKPTEIRSAVRGAVRSLIVVQAPKAKEVLTGIDAVFTACRPASGFKASAGWTCPKTEEAYAALLELRTLVVAMDDTSSEPAAINGDGGAAFSGFPSVSAGGANYTSL